VLLTSTFLSFLFHPKPTFSPTLECKQRHVHSPSKGVFNLSMDEQGSWKLSPRRNIGVGLCMTGMPMLLQSIYGVARCTIIWGFSVIRQKARSPFFSPSNYLFWCMWLDHLMQMAWTTLLFSMYCNLIYNIHTTLSFYQKMLYYPKVVIVFKTLESHLGTDLLATIQLYRPTEWSKFSDLHWF